jgi:hypothetical protein
MVVEIALTLSPNYPLRASSVAINQHLNVGEALWRKVIEREEIERAREE